MKPLYQITSALLLCLGLVACGANSMFEAEISDAPVAQPSAQLVAEAGQPPAGCVSWFDGCNTCAIGKSGDMACTKKACKGQLGEPVCKAFAPGAGAPQPPAQGDDQAAAPETMPEASRAASAEVPANCKIWFDGCNSCVVIRGKLRGCTSKSCTTTEAPMCKKE